MKHTVKPVTVDGCDCEDCRAGHHLYELFRWESDGWRWIGINLQTYANAEECRRYHYWGDVGPHDTWEDGIPRAEPEPKPGHARRRGKGVLDTKALWESFKALKRHWRSPRRNSLDRPEDEPSRWSPSAVRQFILNLPNMPRPDEVRQFIMENPYPAPEEGGGDEAEAGA